MDGTTYMGRGTGHRERTGQQYAEVCYVTGLDSIQQEQSPDYRFIAIREPLRNPKLFDVEDFAGSHDADGGRLVVQEPARTRYGVTGVVTNRELPGDELIRWYRQRCGKSLP